MAPADDGDALVKSPCVISDVISAVMMSAQSDRCSSRSSTHQGSLCNYSSVLLRLSSRKDGSFPNAVPSLAA